MRTSDICEDMPRSPPLSGFWMIVYLVLICSVVGLLFILAADVFRRNSAVKKVQREWEPVIRRRFIEFIGKTPDYIDVEIFWYERGALGTGMASCDGRLYVLDGGTAAEFNWHEVREWSWEVKQPDRIQVIGGNSSHRVKTGLANHRAAIEAYRNNGFSVTVANVDAPVWKYTTSDERTCRRWMEILTQLDERQALAA